MTEAKKTPVEINFGGKTLLDIIRTFKTLGWKKNPKALEGIKLTVMMICGDKNSAEFWHIRSGLDSSGRLQMDHKDKLVNLGDSVDRICETDGQEIVLSRN